MASITGDRIRNLRKVLKMTQKELANAVNVTPQVISNWERGYTKPDSTDLINLSKVFAVSTDYLLEGISVGSMKFWEADRYTEVFEKLSEYSNSEGLELIAQIIENKIDISILLNSNIKLYYSDVELTKQMKDVITDILNGAK